MQFTLLLAGRAPDLTPIERGIVELDPAALLDLDASGQAIRISTVATAHELLACLRRAGVATDADDIIRLPSECCGGCGG